MSSRHASQSQIAGDKSGERSIVSSIIEEEEEDDESTSTTSMNTNDDDDDDNNVEYDSNSQSSTIQEGENEDGNSDDDVVDDTITNATNDDNDDDLSATTYDENDHSTTYRSHYGTSLGPFSEDDETIDDLLLFDSTHSLNGNGNANNNATNNRQGGQVNQNGNGGDGVGDDGDNEETQEEDDDGDDENSNSNDENSNDGDDDDEGGDADDELNINSRRRINNTAILQEAENMLQELLEQYDDGDTSNDDDDDDNHSNDNDKYNISNEQYKEALVHLSSKWEQTYEQISYENEQQFLAMAQERNDLEIEIDEMERRHRDELNIAKQEVMEQSQKIIMQEMKANADRERKSEGAIDKAVRDAIQETKEEMNEEFEIALGGMKAAQEEMQQRYEKLVADTKIRVTHEVKGEADKAAEVKIHSFMENYEEMKNQVVELTMELEKRNMGFDIDTDVFGSGSKNNIDNSVIEAKDNEIEELKEELEEQKKHIQQLREAHQIEVTALETSVRQDKQLLVQKIAIYEESQKSEYDEMVKVEVQKAVQSTTLELNKQFEVTLANAKKSAKDDLQLKYKKLVREAETKARHDVQDEAKSEANHKISAFMQNYEDMKIEIARITEEKEQLKSYNANEIERVQMIVKSKDEEIGGLKDMLESTIQEQQNEFDDELLDMKEVHGKELATLKEQLNLKDSKVQALQVQFKNNNSISKEKEQEIQLLKDAHEDELAKLQALIDNNETKLSQRDIEHQQSLVLVSKNITEEIKEEYEEKIKSLKLGHTKTCENVQGSYDEKFESLKEKYKDEITSLQKSNEEMKLQLSEHEEKAASGRQDEIVSLRSAHETQLRELKASHMTEMAEIRAMLDSVRGEKLVLQEVHDNATDEFRETIHKIKEEHLSNVEKMKLKYKEAKTELHSELVKLKKENEILGKNRASPKKLVQGEKRETIDSNTVEGLSISVRNSQGGDEGREGDKFVLPEARTALSRCVKSGEDNKENSVASADVDSLASALKSASTPPRNKIDHSFQDLSPLTLGSPSPKGTRTTTRQRSATPITPPRMQKNTNKSTRVRQAPDIPRSMTRSSRRVSSSTTASKIRSPTRTRTVPRKSPPGSSIPAPKAVSRRTDPASKKSFSRGGAASKTISTRSSTSSISSTMKVVDRTPAKKSVLSKVPANGVYNSAKNRESNRTTHGAADNIRVMIINPAVSDKMKKMAKILRLELTNDPMEATHVIAGDNTHHIRRTAKLMAALCITSNILKAEWLEDSYKKRSLLSCSHYLLLNDSKAENAYKFSMKQTLTEGRERRRDGGLLASWKIMVCDEVAGNKAPKEADLRMMVEAAGGEWLLSSNIPVPVMEDPTHVIVITSDPALPSQIEDDKASTAAENGAGFFTTTWLFDCMMHQKLFGLRRGIGRL